MAWWQIALLVWLTPPLVTAFLLVREVVRPQQITGPSLDRQVIPPSNEGRHRDIRNFAATAILLVALWAVMVGPGFGDADRTLLEAIYVGHRPLLKFLARQVGHFGAPEATLVLTLMASVILMSQRRYWTASIPPFALLFAHSLAVLQRDLLGRARPDGLVGLESLHAPSLPPTRVVDPMTAYLLFALLLANNPRYRRLAITVALLVGGSNGVVRVLLGHHWPSDSVAGWAFGALVALCAYEISKIMPTPELELADEVRKTSIHDGNQR